MTMARIPIMLIPVVVSMIVTRAVVALAQPSSLFPPQVEQVLFLVDDSSSMTEPAGHPDDPRASRWQVVQTVYPTWLGRLGPDVQVGAVSVGGVCGARPTMFFPVGADRQQITAAIASAQPSGSTNLNAVLQGAPKLFNPAVTGSKRIVLLSDGRNTCPPQASTCEIARSLHRDHGIVIDVVAWITEPGMIEEFTCVTRATGGVFTVPRNLQDMLTIPLSTLDLWRYVVMALSFVTLLFTARILYRQGYHAWGMNTGRATLAGGLLLSLGTLLVYLVLFVGAGVLAGLVGLGLLGVLLAMAWRQASARDSTLSAGNSQWILPIVLAVIGLWPHLAFTGQAPLTSCSKVVAGPARYHHVLVLDVSGSVQRHLGQMKELLVCYAEMYALPGEEISLVIFGVDRMGSVKLLQTFMVPPGGSTTILTDLLNDLGIQDPQQTRTYFKPVADYLNQFLHGIRLQPVVLVVSDGRSDIQVDSRGGAANIPEIPFESFGGRGIYSAPGIQGWQVAVSGGHGLDLTALFQKPIAPATPRPSRLLSHRPAIDPCLLDPALHVETDERIVLQPTWNPFSRTLEGSLTMRVHHDCVARFRSFRVELHRGDERLFSGRVQHTMVEQSPRAFALPMAWQKRDMGWGDTTIHVILEQGHTTRSVYPQPSIIALKELSYWSVYGLYWLGGVVMLLAGGTGMKWAFSKFEDWKHQRPEVVSVPGGNPVLLAPGKSVTIGGVGCDLVIPEIAPYVEVGAAAWTGERGVLTIRPSDDFRVKVDGTEADGSVRYRLGQSLQFVNMATGCLHNVTLISGSARDIAFPGNPTLGGGPFMGRGGATSFEELMRGSGDGNFGSGSGTYI